MKTSELQLDDLAPGVLCTVISTQTAGQDTDVGQMIVRSVTGGKYERWVGHALEILSVDLPFVVVRPYLWDATPGQPIDTREAKLVRVSREFALSQAPTKRKWWQWRAGR